MGWSGPLPSPQAMAGYNEAISDGANRILSLTEREQAHRHEMQKHEMAVMVEELSADSASARLGQVLGFVIATTAIGGAIYLGITDRPVVAALLLTVSVLGVVESFIRGRDAARLDAQQAGKER